MLKKLSYKRKLQLLIGLSVLFSLFIYQSVISKTIVLYNQNKEFDLKLKEASSAPARVQKLTQQLVSLDHLIQSRQTDTSNNVHDLLLGFLSSYCKENKTVLKSFPETSVSTQGEFEIQSHTFAVEGSFIKLLQLVYLLEQKLRIGKVSSLNFQASKDIDTKKNILVSTVYLQNIKKIK